MEEYLLILLALLIITVCLHLGFRIKLYHCLREFLLTTLTFFIVFFVWDVYAIARGHWSFDNQYLVGFFLAGVPFEDLLLFIVGPYFGFIIYKIFERYK